VDVSAAATVKGRIVYRQRIALSPHAVVTVRLEDVSKMDVAATVIAETTLNNPGQVPIAFALPYDPSRIEPGHRYALRVRIEEEGQLRFINTRSVPLPSATDTPDILVEPVSA